MGDYFVHESSYVDEDVTIGKNTKIWYFSHIQRGARIGDECVIGQNVNIANDVIIGNRVKIQNNVSVYEGVELADDVFCGPSMVFTNDFMPRATLKKEYLKTIVEKGVSIGANATIVCGNKIGKYAMIAAGAVVTCDVKPHALMLGVPAKQLGWVCECGEKLDANLYCVTCNKKYKQTVSGIELDR